MADSKAAPEPSMEEILSSIRRIIAEDEGTPPPPTQAAEADEGDEDVLELTEMVADPEPAPPVAAGTPPEQPAIPQPTPSATQEKPTMTVQTSEPLISSGAASASTNAFARLAKAAAPDEKRQASAGITVEQLVVELLTPMLRDWLDQNLPGIVERVVEQEVKKLARRAELT
jgi:cell pole-organizing protein PopZ